MKSTVVTFPISLLALTLLSRGQEPAQKHTIDVQVPAKAGMRYKEHFVIDQKVQQIISEDSSVTNQRENTVVADVTANVEILETGKGGRPSKLKLAILKFDGTVDGEAAPALKAGTEVSAESAGGTSKYIINGAPVEAAHKKILDAMLEINEENKVDPAKLDGNLSMGTKTPRAPGEEWTVPGKDFLEGNGAFGINIDPGSVRVKFQFKALEDHAGIKCARLLTETNMRPDSLPKSKMVLDKEKSSITLTGDESYPVDASFIQLKQDSQSAFHIVGTIDDEGKKINLEIRSLVSRQSERTPVKQP